jgi:hypothetical protein
MSKLLSTTSNISQPAYKYKEIGHKEEHTIKISLPSKFVSLI